jgi:hypothetical protein
MRSKKSGPGGKRARRPEAADAPKTEGRPVTTGDMQEVGATTPEEVEERRRRGEGKAPVHEDPGSQSSG